jgi:hypothetical protein
MKYDILLSTPAFQFNLRCYTTAEVDEGTKKRGRRMFAGLLGRGLHSFTSQVNSSRFGHTSTYPPV